MSDSSVVPLRVAVVGAGPSGFYATEELLRRDGVEVDLYDALPTPFGLVRAGVAPDHPKIKSVTRRYEKTAGHEAFRFFGGVEIGLDVTRDELRARYHAVVYAIGTPLDNRLGIEGEHRPGSHPATDFVAWYNGHPHYADRHFDLSAKTAVVIGNGNVAIDVARMLVLGPDELAVTDAADHALEALTRAEVEHVIILGRRGPAQAAFTSPELLELGELRRADVVVAPEEVALDGHSERWLEQHGTLTARRNVEILTAYSRRGLAGKPRRIELRFLRSPCEVVGEGLDGAAAALRVVRNRIDSDPAGAPIAVATDVEEVIECGLVLRSIGYRGRPLRGVPFDDRRGVILNDGGRVIDERGRRRTGEYAVGWIKRGPSGVIGTNKKDAAETVANLVEDADAGVLPEPAAPDAAAVERWLATRVPALVSWKQWQAIDEHERARGEPHGRPRVKLVRVPDLVAAGRAQVAAGV